MSSFLPRLFIRVHYQISLYGFCVCMEGRGEMGEGISMTECNKLCFVCTSSLFVVVVVVAAVVVCFF